MLRHGFRMWAGNEIERRGTDVAVAGSVPEPTQTAEMTRVSNMAGLLYGVTPHDSSVFLAVALTLTITALVASWGPALRASLVDPVTALRYE
jgi:hypothetical protein